jgi:hypothetical protein
MTPDKVTVAASDLRTLTGAELFTALSYAGLTRAGLTEALAAIQDPDGDPAWGLRGMRFLQATALVLALRNRPDPAPSWEDAQGWDVTADLADEEDPLDADRREYRVAASIATGLPPDQAEAIPVADVEVFAARRRRTG